LFEGRAPPPALLTPANPNQNPTNPQNPQKQQVKKEVDEAVEAAKASPTPPDHWLWKNVYKNADHVALRNIDGSPVTPVYDPDYKQ